MSLRCDVATGRYKYAAMRVYPGGLGRRDDGRAPSGVRRGGRRRVSARSGLQVVRARSSVGQDTQGEAFRGRRAAADAQHRLERMGVGCGKCQ